MNNVVYQIASFMMMRNPVVWRASHVRHHTDTIVLGRDPEIIAMRPPDLLRIAFMFIGVIDVYTAFKRMIMHASGKLDPEEEMYVAPKDHLKVFTIARIWLLIYCSTIALSVLTASILPLMLIGLPRLYGAWHHVMTGLCLLYTSPSPRD